MKRLSAAIGIALAMSSASPAIAESASCFKSDSGALSSYASYDAWRTAQNASASASQSDGAATFEPGGYQTGASTIYISLEARFRTWLESVATALRSDKVNGLIILFK